jgi:hypothetical protein
VAAQESTKEQYSTSGRVHRREACKALFVKNFDRRHHGCGTILIRVQNARPLWQTVQRNTASSTKVGLAVASTAKIAREIFAEVPGHNPSWLH